MGPYSSCVSARRRRAFSWMRSRFLAASMNLSALAFALVARASAFFAAAHDCTLTGAPDEAPRPLPLPVAAAVRCNPGELAFAPAPAGAVSALGESAAAAGSVVEAPSRVCLSVRLLLVSRESGGTGPPEATAASTASPRLLLVALDLISFGSGRTGSGSFGVAASRMAAASRLRIATAIKSSCPTLRARSTSASSCESSNARSSRRVSLEMSGGFEASRPDFGCGGLIVALLPRRDRLGELVCGELACAEAGGSIVALPRRDSIGELVCPEAGGSAEDGSEAEFLREDVGDP